MKRIVSTAIKVTVLVLILVVLALVLRDASHTLRPTKYDIQAPTAAKFAKMARWIPKKAEFYVAVDVPKALSNRTLKDRLVNLVKNREGAAADLIDVLVSDKEAVGMLMLVGELGKPGGQPALAVVVQGRFDQETFIPAVRQILAEGQAGLAAKVLGGRTFFVESDEPNPFGFVILDGEHLAVGSRDSLLALLSGKSRKGSVGSFFSDEPLFGRITFGPRLLTLMPPELGVLKGIDFVSPDGQMLTARIRCRDFAQAVGTRMFLEGIRALLMLQAEENETLQGIVRDVDIKSERSEAIITGDASRLLDLWVPSPQRPPGHGQDIP